MNLDFQKDFFTKREINFIELKLHKNFVDWCVQKIAKFNAKW